VPYVASEDRTLKHMCAWMSFFAAQEDFTRAWEFLEFVARKRGAALREADLAKDNARLALMLVYFDSVFPFTILDRLLLVEPGRSAALRDWLTVTLSARRKLRVLLPKSGENIARDEALLKRVAGSTTPQR
jgi:hypothetical protein